MTSRGVTWDHDPSMLVGQSSESRRVHPLNALGEEASRAPARFTVDQESDAVAVAVIVGAGPSSGEAPSCFSGPARNLDELAAAVEMGTNTDECYKARVPLATGN